MRVLLVGGNTPQEFAANYNEAVQNIERIESQELVDSTTMYVFYDDERTDKPRYYCADCSIYNWGKGCQVKPGEVIRPMQPACESICFGGVQR